MAVSDRPTPHERSAYVYFDRITTRWMDNDAYRHVNNVVYYSFFDTVVNRLLIERALLDVGESPVIGLVVETQCRYFRPIAFPDVVHAGMRVAQVGNSSVRYEIALFRNDEGFAAAQGYFVHVYVDRITQRPTPVPPPLRAFLVDLLADGLEIAAQTP